MNIPDASAEVRTLLESTFLYLINRDYEKALSALQLGRKEWLKELNALSLKEEVEMFFDIMIGQVYEESNNLQVAFKYYMKAKNIDLYYNHPDKAFPFS